MARCDYCKGRGQVGNPESPDTCPYCYPARMVRQMRFTLEAPGYLPDEWHLLLSEWSDGTYTIDAERETDMRGYFEEYVDELPEFDHEPTVEEILRSVTDAAESRAESAWEAYLSTYYSV